VPLGTIIALAIAMLLNQRVRPLGFWRTVYYLPAVVSGVAVALLWGWVLNPDYGLVNLGLGLLGIKRPRWFASEQWAVPGIVLMALWAAGTNMLLYLAGLQSIPTELQEAARMDGASWLQIYWRIMLPLARPALGVVGVLSFTYHWNDYLLPLIYLNETKNFTVSLGLPLLNSRYVTDIQQTMAQTVIAVLPLLVLVFVAQRYYIQGVVVSGVKG
jgi:ABC-type sugar transport system permease subunit